MDFFFISFSGVVCCENDLLQPLSSLAGQHGFCSSFQRGHQQLISSALEANADIDIHHSGHRLQTETTAGWAASEWKAFKRVSSKHIGLVPERHMFRIVNSQQCNHIWTETLDHVLSLIGCFGWQSWTVQLFHTRDKPGLWAMSLLSALSIICGMMLHVCFSADYTGYTAPRKTVPLQSKSTILSCHQLSCPDTYLLCSSGSRFHWIFILLSFFSWQQLKCNVMLK